MKLAISVDRAVHARVARAARQDKMSVSAWLTEAARRSLRIRDGLTAVKDWEKEHGAFTDDELDAARRRVHAQHVRTAISRRARPR